MTRNIINFYGPFFKGNIEHSEGGRCRQPRPGSGWSKNAVDRVAQAVDACVGASARLTPAKMACIYNEIIASQGELTITIELNFRDTKPGCLRDKRLCVITNVTGEWEKELVDQKTPHQIRIPETAVFKRFYIVLFSYDKEENLKLQGALSMYKIIEVNTLPTTRVQSPPTSPPASPPASPRPVNALAE